MIRSGILLPMTGEFFIRDGKVYDVIESQSKDSGDEDVDLWHVFVRADSDELPDDTCPYTFAHTRHWCGYDTCRDS